MPTILPGIDKSGKAKAVSDAKPSAAHPPVRVEETGVPWLDEMQQTLKAEYTETALAGMKVGAHEAYTTKFAPNLGQQQQQQHHQPQQQQQKLSGSPPQGGTSPLAKSRALVPLTRSGRARKAPPPATCGAGKPVPVPYEPAVALESSMHAKPSQTMRGTMGLKDYSMLAMACQRGGRGKTEANAYYKMGELCSRNPETIEKAGRCFERYYTLCRHLKDTAGEAKALNCLGILHQQQGNLDAALQCHRAHLEIAAPSSQFIAHTNIGVVLAEQGDLDGALQSHKNAMHCSIRYGDKQAELLALANLGLVGQRQKDYTTAQICMSRHLELAQVFNDPTAQQAAYEQLALLQADKGDWKESRRFFDDARNLSHVQQQAPTTVNSDRLKCKVGIVSAKGRMREYFTSIARGMGSTPEPQAI